MQIDLSSTINLDARAVGRRVDAFRDTFTKQMGRTYKQSELDMMQTKWAEIQRLVEEANEKIERFIAKRPTHRDASNRPYWLWSTRR